jgi:glycosyltransferase involved in cell wall biosynthesis
MSSTSTGALPASTLPVVPDPTAPIRLLTFTTLYPHAGLPNQGVFVENRLRHLVATGLATSTVLAPVPWFPSRHPRFGGWARFARAAHEETRHGLRVLHPRYAVIPKVGMAAAPAALYAAAKGAVLRLMRQGQTFDLIDSHYLYPDGVVAVALGRRFSLPVVMTARGSDVTQLPDFAVPRRMIRGAMARADAIISVSAGLKRAMVALGADADRITVLRNGVDLAQFRPPEDRAALRASMGMEGQVMLSVGHLIMRKGHHHAIEMLVRLPDWRLVIVGEGPERGRLEALAAKLGVADRVRMVGAQPHAALGRFYGAADLLVLASSREGWANVLLEAMACGTPVVASNIPGNDEVVQRHQAGVIVRQNTPEGFAEAVNALWAEPPSRNLVRAYAEEFSWEATSAGQLQVFAQAQERFAARAYDPAALHDRDED